MQIPLKSVVVDLWEDKPPYKARENAYPVKSAGKQVGLSDVQLGSRWLRQEKAREKSREPHCCDWLEDAIQNGLNQSQCLSNAVKEKQPYQYYRTLYLGE